LLAIIARAGSGRQRQRDGIRTPALVDHDRKPVGKNIAQDCCRRPGIARHPGQARPRRGGHESQQAPPRQAQRHNRITTRV
jgi:hypothetical protein